MCQTIIGNRIAYANYIEGRNIDTNINFNVELISSDPSSVNIEATVNNFIDVTDYSNRVDFERGIEEGGSSPVNQMNYLTNTISVDLTGSPTNAEFEISVVPKAGFSSVQYSIYVKEGTTTVDSLLNTTGNQTLNYNRNTDGDITIYIVSNQGLIYDLELDYRLTASFVTISYYKYYSA